MERDFSQSVPQLNGTINHVNIVTSLNGTLKNGQS